MELLNITVLDGCADDSLLPDRMIGKATSAGRDKDRDYDGRDEDRDNDRDYDRESGSGCRQCGLRSIRPHRFPPNPCRDRRLDPCRSILVPIFVSIVVESPPLVR